MSHYLFTSESVTEGHPDKICDRISDAVLDAAVNKVFDLRPSAIIRDLDLRKPIYSSLSAYGHMGREDLGVAWEKTDRAAALQECIG